MCGQTPVIIPRASTNARLASGMFGQIDVLSIPGAGLRSLDFPSDVHAMFADLFVPGTENTHGLEPTPSPSKIPSRALVRTYGSEDAMWVLARLIKSSQHSDLRLQS